MKEEITRKDLIAYDSGKCDDYELRERIAREAEKEGSFVQRWMAEMDRRAADPFGLIDWRRVALCTEEGEDDLSVRKEKAVDRATVRRSKMRLRRRRIVAVSAVLATAAAILVIVGLLSVDGGLQIRDGDHLVALRDGSLTGLESYPDKWVERAKAVLSDGEVRKPAALEG